jgi:hypothetical protein
MQYPIGQVIGQRRTSNTDLKAPATADIGQDILLGGIVTRYEFSIHIAHRHSSFPARLPFEKTRLRRSFKFPESERTGPPVGGRPHSTTRSGGASDDMTDDDESLQTATRAGLLSTA